MPEPHAYQAQPYHDSQSRLTGGVPCVGLHERGRKLTLMALLPVRQRSISAEYAFCSDTSAALLRESPGWHGHRSAHPRR
jgi:hypothetical protein